VGNVSSLNAEYKNNSSNFGNRVDIWAPGTDIVSAVYNTTAAAEFGITLVNDPRSASYKLGSISGTSMASPQVCGLLACYAEQNQNLDSSEALTYLITHSKKNHVNSSGASYNNYQWFGDNGNNRYLFYKLERPISGPCLPRATFKNRPTSGSVYPRVRTRAKG
jgi:subtilisin family serine protease